MRIKLSLRCNNKIILPVGYSRCVQGFIYNLINKIDADWLHSHGFKYEKRKFKLFTYSEFLESPIYERTKRQFIFPKTVSFLISSPVSWILEQIAKNSLLNDNLRLGNNIVVLSGVEVCKPYNIKSNKIKIKTLTPIEVHSTLYKADGKKKTYYYSPKEDDFSKLVNDNLKKKWEIFFKKPFPTHIEIYPVDFYKCKETVRRFKEIVIRGWAGYFYIESQPKVIEFALDTGIGSRNSIGFGMIDVVKDILPK